MADTLERHTTRIYVVDRDHPICDADRAGTIRRLAAQVAALEEQIKAERERAEVAERGQQASDLGRHFAEVATARACRYRDVEHARRLRAEALLAESRAATAARKRRWALCLLPLLLVAR